MNQTFDINKFNEQFERSVLQIKKPKPILCSLCKIKKGILFCDGCLYISCGECDDHKCSDYPHQITPRPKTNSGISHKIQ